MKSLVVLCILCLRDVGEGPIGLFATRGHSVRISSADQRMAQDCGNGITQRTFIVHRRGFSLVFRHVFEAWNGLLQPVFHSRPL